MSNFPYLSDEPTISATWGATNPATAIQLKEMKSNEDVLKLELNIGKKVYDPQKTQRLINFLESFIQAKNERGGYKTITGFLAAPPLLWTFADVRSYDGDDPIIRIDISRELWFYSGEKPEKIKSSKVLAVDIPRR